MIFAPMMWTAALRCRKCHSEFTIDGVASADVSAVPHDCACPHCGHVPGRIPSAVPAFGDTHLIVRLEKRPCCRQASAGETWHFNSKCSKWPDADYVERETPPAGAQWCNECLVKSGAAA